MVNLMVRVLSTPAPYRNLGVFRWVQRVVAPVAIALPMTMAASSATLAQTLTEDLSVTIYNNTDAILAEFYTTPTNVDSWGIDLLGDGVLESGTSGTVIIDDGSDECVYDIQGVFVDAENVESVVVEDFGVDLCPPNNSYTFTD
jgi:hypothetical protein